MDTGKLILIIGPMFSGKTTELIRYYRRYSIAGRKCLVIKYSEDTRHDPDCLVTHDKASIEAKATPLLGDLESEVKQNEVICVDEMQFFLDGAYFADKWASEGKIVICSGLSGTFQRRPWFTISNLIPLANEIFFLKAICRETGEDASYTTRISGDKEEVVIGGSDKYIATDRKTYLKYYKDSFK